MSDTNNLEFAITNLLNNQPIEDFEGYSANEMNAIVYDFFHKDSPIQFRKNIKAETLEKIPFLLQCEYLLNHIIDLQELKLTAKGYLPTKLVKILYNQKYLKEDLIESSLYKLYKERDSMTVSLTRIILHLSGILKKRNNYLSLTKKGLKLIDDREKLFKTIFETFVLKYNWGYFDGYGEHPTGLFGFGFTLILLNKYGDKEREDTFYGNKYMKAFPSLLDVFVHNRIYDSPEPKKNMAKCYSLRTFDRFLEYFNLVEVRKEGDELIYDKRFIKRSEIFSEIFRIEE